MSHAANVLIYWRVVNAGAHCVACYCWCDAQTLIDAGVEERKITFLNVISCPEGIETLFAAYPSKWSRLSLVVSLGSSSYRRCWRQEELTSAPVYVVCAAQMSKSSPRVSTAASTATSTSFLASVTTVTATSTRSGKRLRQACS